MVFRSVLCGPALASNFGQRAATESLAAPMDVTRAFSHKRSVPSTPDKLAGEIRKMDEEEIMVPKSSIPRTAKTKR